MNLAYYGTPEFEDIGSFMDDEADRNQRIADRKAELIAEAKKGSDTFWGYMHEEVYAAVREAFTSDLPDVDRYRIIASAVRKQIEAEAQAIAEDECD